MSDFDWQQSLRDLRQFQQLQALREIQKQTSQPPPPSLSSPAPAQAPRSLYRCPHCGGDLPDDAGTKQYRKCRHCTGELLWFDVGIGSRLCADQQSLDREIQVDLARSLGGLLGPTRDIPRDARYSAGFCVYCCAIIASFDAKLSPQEIRSVVDSLSWSGMPPASIEALFVKACRRVHADGLDVWLDRLAAMIRDGEGKQLASGMSPGDLLALMGLVFVSGGGDSSQKAKVFRRVGFLMSSPTT